MALLQYPSALIELNKCIELDPGYIKAYTKKGQCQFKMKEQHKALDSYDLALKIDSNNQEAQNGKQEVQSKIRSEM